MELLEFYPTPIELLKKIMKDVDLRFIKTVLEPSAGKGDIADYLIDKAEKYSRYGRSYLDIDCIEINPDLQKILKGKNYRIVHDDFLTYKTFKHYDLIVMNPPFSNADKHLAKAIQMQEENGGAVICILNAQTIKNPYTYERQQLVSRLKEAGADISFMESEFKNAERKTDVEIAVVKVAFKGKERKSLILKDLDTKYYSDRNFEATDLTTNDFIDAITASYRYEVEAGVKLINEYKALLPRMMHNIKATDYDSPILELKTGNTGCSVNAYVEETRMKYWNALFSDQRITGNMTSEQKRDYMSKVEELRDYEFSKHNILTLQIDMSQNLVNGIEECIIKLFDELTYKYHWDESSNNRHYFNGWKTNEAWIVNNKVILPFNGFGRFAFDKDDLDEYRVSEKISDIEKAFRYLDSDGKVQHDVRDVIKKSKESRNTRNMHFTYFDCTFYKKGTCHITFRYPELLKKFNIFGAQHKGWLPPSYAKKKYQEMADEERTVIDSFEGEQSYNKTLANADYFLTETNNLIRLEKAS